MEKSGNWSCDLLCRFRGHVRADGALAVVVGDQVAALNLPDILCDQLPAGSHRARLLAEIRRRK
jgi:hypothetical protein